MNFGPNGHDIYQRTYSRTKPDGSQETWPETVERVVEGNLALVPEEFHMPDERETLIRLMEDMKAIPAGRHLWTSGVPGRQFNRNCHRAGFTGRLADHFVFTFMELMKGGGVGANYSMEYLIGAKIVKVPDIRFHIAVRHKDADAAYEVIPDRYMAPADYPVFEVEDSREGWGDALQALLDAAQDGTHRGIVFDMSKVRPFGAPLVAFGGTASGPVPLMSMLVATANILAETEGRHLRPLEAMSIDHAIATCVVAGNVRRSARMSILHWQDPYIFDFIACKADHQDHWSTNISVEIDDHFIRSVEGKTKDYHYAMKVYQAVVDGMVANGEPGFYNSSLASKGENGDVRATNPCGEIALEGWESCNLGHVNIGAFPEVGDPEVFLAFRLMTRFLIRATFAELLDERQRAIEDRNRRIGVGFFGFQEWAAHRGVRYDHIPFSTGLTEEMQAYARVVDVEARQYARQLGIPRPVKTRTVAPTGTIAKLPGFTEGIHPIYARHFERRVRYSVADPALKDLAARGVTIEDCIYAPNTKVAVFHTEDPILSRGIDHDLIVQADELVPEDFLRVLQWVQSNWADNAVSFTINVPETVDSELLKWSLLDYLPHVKGVTIMPDGSRPQAPYTRITEAEYHAAEYHEVGQSEIDCATGACPVR